MLHELASIHCHLGYLLKNKKIHKNTPKKCKLFISYFTFIFRAGLKAISTVCHIFQKILEPGNHCTASWETVAYEVSSGCTLNIFIRVVYHQGNCSVLQNLLFFMHCITLLTFPSTSVYIQYPVQRFGHSLSLEMVTLLLVMYSLEQYCEWIHFYAVIIINTHELKPAPRLLIFT